MSEIESTEMKVSDSDVILTNLIDKSIRKFRIMGNRGKFYQINDRETLFNLLEISDGDEVKKDEEGREIIDVRNISRKKHIWNYSFQRGVLWVSGRKTYQETLDYKLHQALKKVKKMFKNKPGRVKKVLIKRPQLKRSLSM